MDRKKFKGSKKKHVKSKIKKVKPETALGLASTTVENGKKLDIDELLDVTPLDKRLKGLSKKRHEKRQHTLMSNRNAHVCKVCGVAFKTVSTLKYHLSHYGDPTYPCEECGTKFADEKQLEFHIRQAHVFKHVKKYKFQCPVCNQFVVTNYSLMSHMCHYHEGWENLHPNLFASKAKTTTIVTAGSGEKRKTELKNEEKYMVRRNEARVVENIKECTKELENYENVSSSTVTLENHNSSMIPLESNDSATIPPKPKNPSMIPSKNNISSTLPSENDFPEKIPSPNDISEKIPSANDISEKIPSVNDNSEKIPSGNDISEKIPSENDISEKIPSENDISEKISPKQNAFSTIPLENNITTVEGPEINANERKAVDNEITETMASEIDTVENVTVNITVAETKGPEIDTTENDAVNITVIESKIPESNITETTAPESNITGIRPPESNITETTALESTVIGTTAPEGKITETMAPERNITETTAPKSTITGTIALERNISETKSPQKNIPETKSPEKNIPETKSPEKNISETKSPKDSISEPQVSEINATAPPIDFQNHINDHIKKSDESSRLDGEKISPNEKDASSQKISVQSVVPVNDPSSSSFVKMRVELNEVETLLSDATTAVSEEKDQNRKSPDGSQHPEEVEKSDENSLIESNSSNAVIHVAGELNRNDAAIDGDVIQIDREAELNALHSCKDCYIPLARLNVNRKKERRRGPAKITESRSPGSLFSRNPRKIAPLIDLPVAKPKYLKIDRGPSTFYPCTHCTESFDTHASRLMHVELRHTVIPSIVCDKTFSTRQAILRHYRERHFVYTENKTFCVCGMELIGQTAIHRHFYQYAIKVYVAKNLPAASHSACNPLPTNFGCDKCGATFWLKTCLEYHQTLDCKPSKTIVSKAISTTTGVRKRYKRPHRETQAHICIVCDTAFSSAQQLARHEATYSRREKHQCKFCGTVFNGARLLAGHIQTTHERDPAKRYPYYCGICDQGFTLASAERIHRMHFHRDGVSFADEDTSDSDLDELPMTDSDVSDDETTKECNVCGHEFTSGQRFVNHLVYYTRSEIIECGICLEEFAGQYQAHRHNKLVHYTSESRDAFTHHCTICREGFMWKTHLHAHLCHVHGLPAVEAQCMINLSDSRRNNSQKVGLLNVADTCKICDITFPSPVLLAAHEIENLNDGEFVCNKCSRRCRTASILLDHLSLNHSSTIIQDGVKCRRCNERFQTRSAWVSHVKHFHFSKEPSEFYFERNIASSEKCMRSLRYELNVPTNSSISSGVASFRIKSSFGDSSYTPETIVPDKNILENADARNFIKIEATSTNECRDNGQIVGSGPETPWKCGICSVSFHGSPKLARHKALFSDEGDYMCELCGRRFAWLSIYEEHKKKHCRNDIDKFFCPTCNEGFETLQSQISHEAHLHRRSLGVHRNEYQSADNSQQLKSPNRSFLHPKLPSIVSFFQSGLANEQRSNRYVLGLPDQRKREEQHHETNCWPRLHTEIFEDELSMSYQCPDCQEKYPTLEGMHEHLTIAHNMKQDPSEDVLVDLPEDSTVNLPVDSPEVSSIFIDSVKCEICDMRFVSENLLSVHKNTIHSSCPVVVGKIRNTLIPVENHPSGKRLYSASTHRSYFDHTYDSGKMRTLLPNGQVRKRRYQIRNRPDRPTKSSKPCAKVNSNKPQSVSEATTGMRDSVNGTSKNFQTQVVRCQICDVVFMNKKVLRAHEVNAHGLIFDDDQRSDDSSKGESSGSSSGAIQKLSILVGKLPIAPKDVDGITINMDFESVMIPVTTYDFNITVTKTENSAETPKPIENPFSNSNVDSLPAGNYKVSQLKVRPFAKIVKKLRNQNVHKLSQAESVESTEPPAKRAKKVFDPVAYRELCEQHNLVPPESKKSRAKLSTTEPENTST